MTGVVIHVVRPRHKHVKQHPPAPRPRRRRLARRGLAVAAVFAVTTPVAAVVWPLEGTVESESVPTAAPTRSPRSPAPVDVAPPFESEVAVEVRASPSGTADRKPAKKAREARRSRDAKRRDASPTDKVTAPGASRRSEAEGAAHTAPAAEAPTSGRETDPDTTYGAPTTTKTETRSMGGARDTEPAPRSTPQTTPQPTQEPSPQPAPAPAPEPTPQPTPEPEPEPAPEPEPEPAPEHAPEPAPTPVGPAAVPCDPPSDWWLVVESAGPDAVCTTLTE
jgi:hypothetical protein